LKLSNLTIGNIRSFRERVTIGFHEDLNIFVGPNGGGKSNLLDILTITLRHFIVRPYTAKNQVDGRTVFRDFELGTPFQNITGYLEKYTGDDAASELALTLKIDLQDLAAVRLILAQREKLENALASYRQKPVQHLDFLADIERLSLSEGDEITFQCDLVASSRPPAAAATVIPTSPNARGFLPFLQNFEILRQLAGETSLGPLTPPYMYFSPNRGGDTGNVTVPLATEVPSNYLTSYHQSTSRSSANSLMRVALLYFAEKHRRYESQATSTGYEAAWNKDIEVQLVTKYLALLGYTWEPELLDERQNVYNFHITHAQTGMDVSKASSGEREILNLLFAVFAFNAQGGCVIIDEPELHLHPKWQRLLLQLLRELPSVISTQLIVCTHSPSFIGANSVSNVARVYRDGDKGTKVVGLGEQSGASARDLLHMVNAENNEKMFFADVVLLAEGIMDRLIFERIIELIQQTVGATSLIEVLEVRGKESIERYRNLLVSKGVRVYAVVDRDYVAEAALGESEKALLSVDVNATDRRILNNKKSNDRKKLYEILKAAVDSGDLAELKAITDYIGSRFKSLREDLDDKEREALEGLYLREHEAGTHILHRGEIEDYLPKEAQSLAGVIQLTKHENFRQWVTRGIGTPEIDELLSVGLWVACIKESPKDFGKRLASIGVESGGEGLRSA
jgi:putative ATP-dependent endonuclease of the OLD family